MKVIIKFLYIVRDYFALVIGICKSKFIILNTLYSTHLSMVIGPKQISLV